MPNLRLEVTRRKAVLMVDGLYFKPAVVNHAQDLWDLEKLGRHASAAEAYNPYGPSERNMSKREIKAKETAASRKFEAVLGGYKWNNGSRWVDLPLGTAVGSSQCYQDDPEKMLKRKRAPSGSAATYTGRDSSITDAESTATMPDAIYSQAAAKRPRPKDRVPKNTASAPERRPGEGEDVIVVALKPPEVFSGR